MSPIRNTSWLVAGVLAFLVAAPARADENRLEDFQLFAPAETRSYDDDPEPSRGYYFTFDGLFWTIGPPARSYVGLAPNAPGGAPTVRYYNSFNAVLQQSTMTNSFISAKPTDGNAFEFGYVGEENGWNAAIYDLRNQDHNFNGSNDAVVFRDPLAVLTYVNSAGLTFNAPVTYRWTSIDNHVDHWSGNLAYVRRFKPFHHGGVFELLLGARYMEFNEQFQFRGWGAIAINSFNQSTTTSSGDSYWLNRVDNHVLGPQLGGRWFRKTGRWTLLGEGFFTAGFNRQNYYQTSKLFENFNNLGQPVTGTGGSATTFALASQFPDGGARGAFKDEFAPILEVKAELKYQLTRAISAHVGWNGLWMDGIARASNTIDYQVGTPGNPVLGFNLNNSRESVFVTGVAIGIDVNR